MIALLTALSVPAAAAAADPANSVDSSPVGRRHWPCPGCITFVPSSYTPDKPAPLMVALHGDGASTDLVVRMWKAPLERRGYILLALRCPRELGCDNSFWRWHGNPAWIMAQVDAVEAAYSIDPSRIYLSGWSGGSTYMGLSAPLLSPRFAAINLNGGGVPPPSSMCSACKPPVYYFVGGKNPMISFVEGTRDYFKRCGHEVVWDVEPNLDHPGELQAIFAGPVAERVVAWLDTKRNTCAGARAAAPSDAKAADAAPEAAPRVDEDKNSIELPFNTPPDGTSSDPGALGSEGAASPSSSTIAPRSGPVPGGCGCRPAIAARSSDEDPPRSPRLPAGSTPVLAAFALAVARLASRSLGRRSPR